MPVFEVKTEELRMYAVTYIVEAGTPDEAEAMVYRGEVDIYDEKFIERGPEEEIDQLLSTEELEAGEYSPDWIGNAL